MPNDHRQSCVTSAKPCDPLDRSDASQMQPVSVVISSHHRLSLLRFSLTLQLRRFQPVLSDQPACLVGCSIPVRMRCSALAFCLAKGPLQNRTWLERMTQDPAVDTCKRLMLYRHLREFSKCSWWHHDSLRQPSLGPQA